LVTRSSELPYGGRTTGKIVQNVSDKETKEADHKNVKKKKNEKNERHTGWSVNWYQSRREFLEQLNLCAIIHLQYKLT
jgi:hypothetical protein